MSLTVTMGKWRTNDEFMIESVQSLAEYVAVDRYKGQGLLGRGSPGLASISTLTAVSELSYDRFFNQY